MTTFLCIYRRNRPILINKKKWVWEVPAQHGFIFFSSKSFILWAIFCIKKKSKKRSLCWYKKADYKKKTTYYYLLAEYHFRFLSLHNSQHSKWSANQSFPELWPYRALNSCKCIFFFFVGGGILTVRVTSLYRVSSWSYHGCHPALQLYAWGEKLSLNLFDNILNRKRHWIVIFLHINCSQGYLFFFHVRFKHR